MMSYTHLPKQGILFTLTLTALLMLLMLMPSSQAKANAIIDVTNPDWDNFRQIDPDLGGLYWFETHFMLSDMLDQASADNHAQRQVVPVRIHNRGTEALQITDLTFSDPTIFTLPNGEINFSIPAGGDYILEVAFTTNLQSGDLPDDLAQVFPGELYIESSDPNTPTFTVTLRALLMESRGGPREPLTQDLLNGMFGFGLDFGTWDGAGHPHGDSAIPSDPIGDEVHAKFWTRNDPSEPIYSRLIVSYAGRDSDEYARLIFDETDSNGNDSYTMQRDGFNSQMVLPKSGVSFHSWETAPPGSGQNLRPIENNGDFYYFIAGPGSEQCIGPCQRGDVDQPKGQGVRTYPARDANGTLIPNVYVVVQDLNLFSFANFDFQDHMLLVTNVRPVQTFTDLESSLTATPNPVFNGDNVTLTYSVYNAGVYGAQNTSFDVLLPNGALNVQSITPDQGSCSGTSCNLGTVAPDQTVNITVQATVQATASFTADGFANTSTTEFQTNDNDTRITISVTNQDSATLTVIKEATPESDTTFNFNATGGIGAFSLVDDGEVTPNNFLAHINIQEDTNPIEDFTPDTGAAYGARPNGETYGWFSAVDNQPFDATGLVRDRGNDSTLLSTMIHAQFPDCCSQSVPVYWEHEVPNGRYRVTVAVGDQNQDATVGTFHAVNVEGVRAVNFAPLFDIPLQHTTGSVIVDVTDGRVTVAPDPDDGFNTKIHYIIIEGVPQTNNEVTFYNLAAGTYDITETIPTGWTFTGATCEGGSASSITNGVSVSLTAGTAATCTFTNAEDPSQPPQIVTNDPLVIQQGASGTITDSLLLASDTDNTPAELIYTVGTTPANGDLLLDNIALANGETFTQADINSSLLTYAHDDSASTSDSFTFTLSDGTTTLSAATFTITITPDSVEPIIVTNNPLAVDQGAFEIIDETLLLTSDSDTTPDNLFYVLSTIPANGILYRDTTPLAADDFFTQADINNDRIGYLHDSGTATTDNFDFTVTDGTTPTAITTFQINITPITGPAPVNLTVTGDLSAFPLDVDFGWQHSIDPSDTQVPADWYNVVILSAANVVLNTWLEATECTGITCSLPYRDNLDYAFPASGTYSWWVGAWSPDAQNQWLSTYSNEATFPVDYPATAAITGLNVTPNQGRPTITWDHDPVVGWFNIWIGNANTTVFYEWVEKTTDICAAGTCTFTPNINPLPGTYSVWMQSWGPNGFSAGGIDGWAGAVDFTVSDVAPAIVTTGFNATMNGDSAILTWDGVANATWYQVWLGQENNGNFTTNAVGWYLASDLACENAATCTLTPDVILPVGAYTWTVQAWGPGGFNGNNPNAWAALQTFNVGGASNIQG